jgi:release factor glutamine methyltransferase
VDDTLPGRDDLPPPVPPGLMPPAPSLRPAGHAQGLPPAGVATTVRGLVAEVAAMLARAGSELTAEPRSEARDIVAALLDVPRFWPAAHPDEVADAELRDAALVAAARRLRGAPFAYAVGRAAFRHMTLDVDERVLIPRAETELLVDEVLRCLTTPGGVAVDVGTGSGALALALAMEGRFSRVVATDLSLDALVVARANHARLSHAMKAPVEFRHGSLLAPVARDAALGRVRAVVSNPPYIAHHEARELPRTVRDWEPALALFSGADGMDAIRALVVQAAPVLEAGGLLAMEVDARRASLAAEAVATHGAFTDVRVRLDLAGRERFVLARRA